MIAIAKARSIKVIERHIKPEEMTDFSECFLTGSAAEVTPVSGDRALSLQARHADRDA